jgi:hypothetical protein
MEGGSKVVAVPFSPLPFSLPLLRVPAVARSFQLSTNKVSTGTPVSISCRLVTACHWHAVNAKPLGPRRGLLFEETRQPDRVTEPMLFHSFTDDLWSSVDAPRRPWPPLRHCCPGASKDGHYLGTYGRPLMSPLRLRAKTRWRRVHSSWSWSGSSNGTPRPARRRTRATVQKPFQRRGEVFTTRQY